MRVDATNPRRDAGISRRAFLYSASTLIALPSFAAAQTSTRERPMHPALSKGLQALERRRWRELSEIVRAEKPQSAVVLIDELGEASKVDANIDGLSAHPLGDTIGGGLMVNWGWRYRGSGLGADLGLAQILLFQQRLEVANGMLATAFARDPDDGVAASFLIRASKGREDHDTLEETFRAFEKAARRPIAGYAGYADAISEKWSGSRQRMLGFARQRRASLPPSSYALLAQAHTESFFTAGQSSEAEAAAYLAQEFVRGELIKANDDFHAAARDPDPFANRFAHGHFSFLFAAMDEADLARPHLQAMGRYPAGPWLSMDDPIGAIDRARQILGIAEL